DGADVIDLDDGTTAEGHASLLAVGRTFPLDDLGLEHYGIDTSERRAFPRDGRLRVADGLWVIGDPAGPELHTHQAHYQGELAIRMAMGLEVHPDYRALPRATYTDPEAASVGLTVEQAKAEGIDAVEYVADFATSSRGYALEAKIGHVTLTFDRKTRELVGAAMACPDASAAIHECVLAVPGSPRRHPRCVPGDPGPGPGRGPGRYDPRLPVDVADPQRPVRGRPEGPRADLVVIRGRAYVPGAAPGL